jgi:hypothetical protein
MLVEACPSISENTSELMFLLSSRVAHVWRRSWKSERRQSRALQVRFLRLEGLNSVPLRSEDKTARLVERARALYLLERAREMTLEGVHTAPNESEVRRLFLGFGSSRMKALPAWVSARCTRRRPFSRSTSSHLSARSSPWHMPALAHAGVEGQHVEGFEPSRRGPPPRDDGTSRAERSPVRGEGEVAYL